MSFIKYLWKDRNVQYPGRRRLINVDDATDEQLVDVERVNSPSNGDRFTSIAGNDNMTGMNGLEERIDQAFQAVQAVIDQQLNLIYPVGAIYQSFSDTDPATIFPNTQWTRLPDNRVLVADTTPGQLINNSSATVNANGSITVSLRATGDITMTGSIQAANSEIRPHAHNNIYVERLNFENASKPNEGNWPRWFETNYQNTDTSQSDVGPVTSVTGGGKTHSHGFGPVKASLNGVAQNIDIRQPYMTIYAWRRTN